MKKTELGRSMIEMLGVLSIVGILSTAGITSYNQAMLKVRSNRTIDAIHQIEGGIRALYADQVSYEGLSGEMLVATGLATSVKKDPQATGKPGTLVHPFGGEFNVAPDEEFGGFIITLKDLNQKACVNVMTGSSWGTHMNYLRINGALISTLSDVPALVNACNRPQNMIELSYN